MLTKMSLQKKRKHSCSMFKFMFDEHLIFIYYLLRCSNYILCLLLISLIIYSFKYVFIFCYIQAYNARFFSPLQPSFLLFYVYTWSLEAYFNTPPYYLYEPPLNAYATRRETHTANNHAYSMISRLRLQPGVSV